MPDFSMEVTFGGAFFNKFQTPDAMNAARLVAMNAAAIELEGIIKDQITPFTRTGRLRSSIAHQVSSDGSSAHVGTNVVYARPVEFGHHSFGGHHYMEKSFNQKDKVINAFKRAMQKQLDQIT